MNVARLRTLSQTVIALYALSGAYGARAVASSGPLQTVDYRINPSAFTAELGGQDPTRAITYAVQSWNWSGGSRRYFRNIGTTTQTSCTWNSPPWIWADAGCAPNDPDCSIRGWNYYCGIGGFEVRLFMGAETWSLNPANGAEFDLHGTVAHEFGHDIVNGPHDGDHINPVMSDGTTERCQMNSGSFTPTAESIRRRFFCSSEINNVGAAVGHPADSAYQVISSFRPGTIATSFATESLTGIQYGFGLGEISRTSSRNEFFVAAPYYSTPVNPVKAFRYPYPTFNEQLAIPNATPVVQRPSVAFDSQRGRRWVFWRHGPADPSQNLVHFATSDSGTTFTFRGDVRDSDGVGITTRVPVGAAYDAVTDRIVVVFNVYEESDFFPPCTARFGCMSRLAVVTTSASGNGETWTAAQRLDGSQAMGPPAIACENNSSALRRCNVVYTAPDAARNLHEITFSVATDGTLTNLTADTSIGSNTDFPVGLTWSGPNRTGKIVLAFTSVGHQVFVRQKNLVGDPWSSATAVSSLSKAAIVRLGPSIRYEESAGTYHIVYAH